VYGLARSLLAFGTLVTLLVHDVDALFRPLGAAVPSGTATQGLMQWSLFELLSGSYLEFARWIAVGILVITISGWRPRVTSLLHWWVTMSYASSAVIVDGGDQLASVLTLLLVPIALTDSRRWHWTEPPPTAPTLIPKIKGLVAHSTWLVIRLQVSIVYLHAFVGKLSVQEWINGTVVHYWFRHPVFGVPSWMEPIVYPIIENPVGVMALTWGTIALEMVLAAGLFMKEHYRPWLLSAGLLFHGAIAIVHGLFTFFFSCAAALILYLRTYDAPFPIDKLIGRVEFFLSNLGRTSSTKSKETVASRGRQVS
jgi:antimicrobial peptide system SdpB family protein